MASRKKTGENYQLKNFTGWMFSDQDDAMFLLEETKDKKGIMIQQGGEAIYISKSAIPFFIETLIEVAKIKEWKSKT